MSRSLVLSFFSSDTVLAGTVRKDYYDLVITARTGDHQARVQVKAEEMKNPEPYNFQRTWSSNAEMNDGFSVLLSSLEGFWFGTFPDFDIFSRISFLIGKRTQVLNSLRMYSTVE